jgi:hypothetical protein
VPCEECEVERSFLQRAVELDCEVGIERLTPGPDVWASLQREDVLEKMLAQSTRGKRRVPGGNMPD